MSDKTIFVTGGAGYIGSHACKALSAAGFIPITYDNLSSGHEWAVKWGPLEKGDILDRERLNEVIAEYHPSAVMHFAAFAYVGESVTDPAKYYRNNVVGSLNILEAMHNNNIDKIVFSSTCAIYGVPDCLPIREDTPQAPINPYGASKLMAERMIADFASAYGTKWAALRYFNAAGADPDGQIGELHDPETHLIPLVLDAAAGAADDISVFGNDYDTRDGTCIRDYVHVCDLAAAHVMALNSLKNDIPSGAYNLGTGEGASVLEVIRAAQRVTQLPVPTKYEMRRMGDPPALLADAAKARETLGWVPGMSSIDEIIATAWVWRQHIGAEDTKVNQSEL